MGPYAFARFYDPVAELGVLDIRYTLSASGEMDWVCYIVGADTPKEQVAQVARRARDACAPIPCAVYGRSGDGKGHELWAPDLGERLALLGQSIAQSWRIDPVLVADL